MEAASTSETSGGLVPDFTATQKTAIFILAAVERLKCHQILFALKSSLVTSNI
jgi:hypothetical protein